MCALHEPQNYTDLSGRENLDAGSRHVKRHNGDNDR